MLDRFGVAKLCLFFIKLKIFIGDFGVCKKVENDDRLIGTEGTYHFMAPESLKSTPGVLGYSGTKADVWSLGVSLFAYTFLELPFFSENIM